MRQLIILLALLLATINASFAQYIPAHPGNTPAGRDAIGLRPRKLTSGWIEQGGTTIRSIGQSITATGTASTLADPLGTFTNYASSGAGSGTAGWVTAIRGTELRYKPVFTFKIKTGANATDITACRIFAGISSTANMFAADGPTTSHYLGIRYCPGTDGTAFWRITSNDASGAPATTTTEIAVTTDTCYEWVFDCANPASILVYCGVGGAVPSYVATINTADLPASTQRLDGIIGIGETEAVAKNIRIALFHMVND